MADAEAILAEDLVDEIRTQLFSYQERHPQGDKPPFVLVDSQDMALLNRTSYREMRQPVYAENADDSLIRVEYMPPFRLFGVPLMVLPVEKSPYIPSAEEFAQMHGAFSLFREVKRLPFNVNALPPKEEE